MSLRNRLLTPGMAALLVVGLPPVLTRGPDAPGTGWRAPEEPAARLLASPASLWDLYREWEGGWREGGGDREVLVTLTGVRGLTHPSSTTARGVARLDLIGGAVEAEVRGLDAEADLWLVDNRPGGSALPEPGDRLVRLGRLRSQGGTARLHRDLGGGFFRRFELDLAVVTKAGERPQDGALLYGSRPLFERLYTRSRQAAEIAAAAPRRALSAGTLAALLAPRPARADAPSLLVRRELVSRQVADGAELFFRGTFGGNGRTCSTCHRVERNFIIDTGFIAGLPDDDPLFVAERPVEEGGVPGLEIPEMLRRFGLVVENVDGAEDPTRKLTLRGVPHSFSMATSVLAPRDDERAPLERTGWSGDGAPMTGALRFFALGAIIQHFPRSLDRVAGVDFRLPGDEELDALEAYTLSVGRLRDPRLTSVLLADPAADRGRVLFIDNCFPCHANGGALSRFGGNRNFDTGIERLPHPARQRMDFPPDGGFGTEPFDSDGDGVDDAFGDGTFNVPSLVEAADTAPFFHNNVAATLEEAVAFYAGPEFDSSPGGELVGGIDLTEGEIDEVAAFLRVLNASFNIELAVQRTAAARSLVAHTFPHPRRFGSPAPPGESGELRSTAASLLALANIEIADAIRVLDERGLHPEIVQLLRQAVGANEGAAGAATPRGWTGGMEQALESLEQARRGLGRFNRGIFFVLGEGNLLF